MSVRSLVALAVARDKAKPGTAAGGGRAEAAVAGAAGGEPAETGGVPQQFVDVVTSAIPSEPLAAYTALLGVAAGTINKSDPRAYLPFRWWVYGVFLFITTASIVVGYFRASRAPTGTEPDNRRPFPGAELGAALIAAGAWGLAMPGSAFNTQVSGTPQVLTTASMVVGAAAFLALLSAPQLKAGSSTPGQTQ
jgi:hypothetical protein